MAMRVEYIGIYRHGVLDQALAEEPKAGPPVENEQVPAASDFDAGRIAAVAADAVCAAGDAAANPPETHADVRHRSLLALLRHCVRQPGCSWGCLSAASSSMRGTACEPL